MERSYVTYLLGAGASAGKREDGIILEGLPCVKEIPNRLKKLCDLIESTKLPVRPPQNSGNGWQLYTLDEWNDAKKHLLNDLRKLQSASAEHSTIDTYAKKLYYNVRIEEFEHLERMLTFYFVVEQARNKPDSRYDAFLANILKRGDIFPRNIKIISWNYDSQIEIAYSEYGNPERLQIGTKKYQNYQEYDIMKINGTASFEDSNVAVPRYKKFVLGNQEGKNEDERNIELLYDILPLYEEYVVHKGGKNGNPTDLSFAFDERAYPSQDIFRWADEQIERTKALVIIGYTFPFFNREIDRKILSKLNPTAKIYIQDLNTAYVKQSLQAVLTEEQRKIEIIELENTDQFYLPPEL